MPNPENRPGKINYEKSFLHEGEDTVFTLNSLTPDGAHQQRVIVDQIDSVAQGQFRGDVLKLTRFFWVNKTALPTESRYGVPLRLLRNAHERLRPFLPRHFEAEAQLEHVGQKILRSLVHGYFGERFKVPDSIGYTFLPGTGYCQVIEKIDNFSYPQTAEEIEQVFQAQSVLTEFCRQFGLVEPSAQIHKDNPLAPSNLVFIKKDSQKRICWLDVHPGIKMRPSGYVVPTFYFPFHKTICRQTIEDGEQPPAFNRIHVKVCREAIADENNQERLMENLGEKGYQELQDWLSLYNQLLEKHDETTQLSAKEQWAEAWKESGDVPESAIERVGESDKLFLLARWFGIRPVMFFINKEYRKWAVDGWREPERREQSWERLRKRQVKTLQEKERIGKDNELETKRSLILNALAGKVSPTSMQRLITDREFRNLEEATRYFVLGGARNAHEHGVITDEDLEKLKKEVGLQNLSRKEMGVYLSTFLAHQAIARGADFFEISSYLAALASPGTRLQRAALGFTGGWIAPVALRLALTKAIEFGTKVDMSTAMKWLWGPKFGHYIAILDQIGTALGNPRLRELAIRSRVATLLFLNPTLGLGSKFDLSLAKKLLGEEKPRRRSFPRARRIKFVGRVGKYAIDKPAQWLHKHAPKGEAYLNSKWKRVFDFASVIPITLLGGPIILAEAGYVALKDKANPFYALPCVGRKGQTYGRWKIRTMVQGARHWPGYEVPMIIKSDKDPRVTHSRLRKGSIDEFPQVWNVLTGEMAVVGPIGRPPKEIGYIEEVPRWRPEYKKLVGRYLESYLQTRPGITGLAQIMGRGNLTLFENAMLEVYYLKNASWVLDLSILLGTPLAVISGVGAY